MLYVFVHLFWLKLQPSVIKYFEHYSTCPVEDYNPESFWTL